MGTMRLALIGIALLLIIVIANSVYIVTDKQTAILLGLEKLLTLKLNRFTFQSSNFAYCEEFDSRVLLDAIPQPYFTAEKNV